jgi:hypothetical protein
MGPERDLTEGPRPATARELQTMLLAERDRVPFLIYRGSDGEQQLVRFGPDGTRLTIGRSPTADLSIVWDDRVSALHAVIERIAGELTVRDDGISRNGSYVNGEHVHGMRRLRDRDVLRVGRSSILVRNPDDGGRDSTSAGSQPLLVTGLSEQQRKVLGALCRVLEDAEPIAMLPTNQEIANELHLSVGAVKAHLRVLFDKFRIADLPQNKKRVALAHRALQSGLLNEQDLRASRDTEAQGGHSRRSKRGASRDGG